jgi:hypothetical protein
VEHKRGRGQRAADCDPERQFWRPVVREFCVPALRARFDEALLALGRLDAVTDLLPSVSLLLCSFVRKEAGSKGIHADDWKANVRESWVFRRQADWASRTAFVRRQYHQNRRHW